MATASKVKSPRTLARTGRWAEPGSRSAALFARAQGVLPGGNSRTTVYMTPYPPYAASGDGCWITDVEGDRRLDCLNNYTALIHGHAHPAIVEAATRRLAQGASFPLPTPEEVDLAALLCERVPSAERVRFTNSGSEAVMVAIKGARAFTGRPKIAKFEGAYHGSYDYAEVSLASTPETWGSLAAPASTAYSRGTPPAVLEDVVVLPFNHTEQAVARIEREARHLAAVLVDPVPNRVGLIPAQRDFLQAVREVTRAHGIVLIFDEVIAFRVGYHGAQGALRVTPDMTTLGKIIGGGFPVGAVAGRADVMAVFDPTRGGPPAAPHGGTFNANPVTMAAGLAAMRLLTPDAYGRLADLGDKLRASLDDCFKQAGLPGRVTGLGSLFRLHPMDRALSDYRSTRATPAEAERLVRLVRRLMEHGVLMSVTGLGCLSTPMGDSELEGLVETFAAVLQMERGA
ncbi:MAG: aspartate aminotransferase family protein [Candidatus Rokuibacteriota bacterium]|nr:MAG: aspartate aminotransferase family protein [Candidatus Rokubacteria bacterium]